MEELYTDQLKAHLSAVEEALPLYLPKDRPHVDPVTKAMTYACQAGGKRLRPVLLLEFCRLAGGDTYAALPFACALEMIHSYSLIHDDLPCMDNSPLRRGKPSVHVQFGEDMALLAGDALLNRAFEVMLLPDNTQKLSSADILRAARTLADKAGIGGMVGGQVIDLVSEGKSISIDILEQLQLGKTAALFEAACVMGVQLAGRKDLEESADLFGKNLGLCFQIVDDLLDVTSTPEEIGKPVGSDMENRKATYVSLLGLEEAKRLAETRTATAIEALDGYGDQGESLRRLASALLTRSK